MSTKVRKKFNTPWCCSGFEPGPPCADGGVSCGCPPPAQAPAWPFSAVPSDWPPSSGPTPVDASAQSPHSEEITFWHYLILVAQIDKV